MNQNVAFLIPSGPNSIKKKNEIQSPLFKEMISCMKFQ